MKHGGGSITLETIKLVSVKTKKKNEALKCEIDLL